MSDITVLMPVYNAEKYLQKSIESILNQTFKDFHFLIINDGSSDGSEAVIKKYADNDSRISFISRENKGLVKTLNEGLDMSTTEYVARMDADDVSRPCRLARQLAYMQIHPEIACLGTYAYYHFFQLPFRIKKRLPITDEEIKLRMLFSSPMIHPSVMLRKSFLDKNDIRYNALFHGMEDYELWMRLGRFAMLANIPEYLYDYTIWAGSTTQIQNKNIEQRKILYRKLFSAYFKHLGIPFSEYDLRVHSAIVLEGIIMNTISLNEKLSWLNKLKNFLVGKYNGYETYIEREIKWQIKRLQQSSLRFCARKILHF